MSPEDIAALPYRPCVGVMLINREGLVFAGQRIDRVKYKLNVLESVFNSISYRILSQLHNIV